MEPRTRKIVSGDERNRILIGLILILIFLSKKAKGSVLSKINELDASVQGRFREFLTDVSKMGYKVVIREAKRSTEQQAIYHKKDPRNAIPGLSKHETGMAIDIDLFKKGKVLNKNTPKNRMGTYTEYHTLPKTKHKILWGGDFKGYADNNHFYFQS